MRPEDWQPDRRQLVRLCATISGDPRAAEDLAQEVLLEAWRNLAKVRDPEGADRWIAAVARNVCRRWARSQAREAHRDAAIELAAGPLAAPDVALELERAELAHLLDRALGLLPAATRDVLVARFIKERSRAEIAAELGLSEDAVSMRISRGKLVMRRLLSSDLRDEATGYAAVHGGEHAWRETRVWCTLCGRHRLHMRRELPPGSVGFRCPACEPHPSALASEFRLANPYFDHLLGRLVRPTAILARATSWSHSYFDRGGAGAETTCTSCGASIRLRLDVVVQDHGGEAQPRLHASCQQCGEQVSTSAAGLASARPEVRQLQREHRIRARPTRQVTHAGAAADVLSYEDVNGAAHVDVVVARDTLRVLHVAGSGC